MTGKAIIFYHVFMGEQLIHYEIKNTDTYQLTFNGSFKFKNQTRLVIGWKTGQTKLYYTTVQKRRGPFTFNLGNENVKKVILYGKVKSAYEPSGQSGWSVSQFL